MLKEQALKKDGYYPAIYVHKKFVSEIDVKYDFKTAKSGRIFDEAKPDTVKNKNPFHNIFLFFPTWKRTCAFSNSSSLPENIYSKILLLKIFT